VRKIKDIIKSFSDERWNIGFIENSLDSVMRGDTIKVNWVRHNLKNCWFADPFILDVTDTEIIVLVEEWYKPIHKGRISKLIIDRNTYLLKDKCVVLELDTHLSFPVIERHDDQIFIYPENGAAGGLWLYKYDPILNSIKRISLLCDVAVEDAVATNLFGGKKLFATKQPNPNGNVLEIYDWDSSMHKYIRSETCVFTENIARMAGDFFEYHGKIYRPAQECNVQYGHAVTIQEVNRKDGKWLFHEIRRMYSVNPKLTIGMHTFNMYKGLIVTDALGFDNMWLRKILKTFKLVH
jgi:hypothetical protein